MGKELDLSCDKQWTVERGRGEKLKLIQSYSSQIVVGKVVRFGTREGGEDMIWAYKLDLLIVLPHDKQWNRKGLVNTKLPGPLKFEFGI